MLTNEKNMIHGYELLERIGSGGFGSVYRARQATINREVAIKIIKPELANTPNFIRRFETEAQLVARLEHPFIIPLIDYWRDPDGAYLVMRYLRSGSIRDALDDKKLDVSSVVRLLEQIASALDFAHRNDVIHRDIKPGNILLDEDNNAYLADFGIAKDLASVQGNLTDATDVIVGSLDYISPEQARSQPITPRTDIYSLGVMLYEMLTGEHPFKECSSVERLYKHINEPLPQITDLPHDIKDDINNIIQKATAKNPDKRYPDVLSLSGTFRDVVIRDTSQSEQQIVEQLTMRQHEVLQYIADGLTNREIAEKLFVTEATVKWHIKQSYSKLGVRSRVQAIIRARELDLIGKGDPDSFDDIQPADSPTLAPLPEPENPYKGLHAFQAVDSRDFFGREDLVEKLIQKMSGEHEYQRFLAIVGPSGCGKSSVVKAGLIPALWKNRLSGSEKWFIVDLIPGMHPIDKLETALIRVSANPTDNLYDQLTRNERGLLRIADIILPDDDTELVLVIDQFEEVFTLVDDESERVQFLELLHTAVTTPQSRIRVIITLRADYYDRPLHYPSFGEMLKQRMETVLPLSAKGLERAIRGPAERVGIIFEGGLVEQIVSEMNYQAGALPLMQYALTELYERREERLLTHRAYSAIGGAGGALANRAEELFENLSQEAQDLTQQIFLRLVTLGEGAEDTRRRATQAELLSLTNHNDLMEEIIDQFAGYRLLSFDHDPETRQPTVEVAHEAILREWERLRQWLNDSRDDIRQERLVAQSAAEWDSHQRDNSYLLLGNRLEQIESWEKNTALILTPLEQEFISSCIEQRDRGKEAEAKRKARENRLEKRSRIVLLALVAVFAIAAIVAGSLAVATQSNFLRAERIRLAAQAQIALDSGEDVRIPALLALRSLKLGYSPEADAALLNALSRDFTRQTFVGHSGGGISGVHFSPDGNQILTTSADATARLWDAVTGEELQRFAGHLGIVYAGVFMQDGNTILTGGNDGTVRQWDVTTGKEIRQLLNIGESIVSIALSPDEQYLATSDVVNQVQVWRLNDMELVYTIEGHIDLVNQVAFSPDGGVLATASFDRSVGLWDVETGDEIHRLEGHAARVFGVAFSPDNRLLATSSEDSTVRLWDVETGEEMNRLIGHTGAAMSASFSADGRTIASSGNDLSVYLWDVERGDILQEFRGHTALAGFTDFSPDGQFIVSGGTENIARLWEIHLNSEPRIFSLPFSAIHADSIVMATLSDDGGHIISVHARGDVVYWDIETSLIHDTFIVDNGGFIRSASLLADGNRILMAGDDGITRLWDITVTPTLIRQYAEHSESINNLTYSSTNDWFVTGSDDHTARLWSIDSDTSLIQFEGHKAPIRDVALSSDNRLAATASDDGTARLWDVETGEEIRQLIGHQGAVLSVALSPDGQYVITGGDDNTALLWDADTGEIIHQLIGHTHTIRVVAFTPDNRTVITGSRDSTLRFWDVGTGEVTRQFVGHEFPIQTVSTVDNRNLIVTGDLSDTYLWLTQLEDVIALACQKLSSDLTGEERAIYQINDNDEVCT